MRGLSSRLSVSLLAVLGAVTLGACAEAMDDVNRVQPNYYDKSLFEGTWYYKQTVIDVPYEVAWIFQGYGSRMDKIRWEIQEKQLIAYRANEMIPGANGEPSSGKPTFTPLAAWAISSHFDIIRDYNPSTGEKSNVIRENSTDRPWYERKYIRVDWSRNLIPNFSYPDKMLSFQLMTGAPYWIQEHEEDNPDRAEISSDYIGIVGLYDVMPDQWACYRMLSDMNFGVGPGLDCGPATIKFRHSFRKVDPKAEPYEPLPYPDVGEGILSHYDVNRDGVVDEHDIITKSLRICSDVEGFSCVGSAEVPCTGQVLRTLADDDFFFQFEYSEEDCSAPDVGYFKKFGYFRNERVHYDREKGLHDSGRNFQAKRWNIWERSYDEDGRPIPYEERTVKPIVFHLNATFPEDLYPVARRIEREWNEAFVETVAALQGKDPSEVPPVFVVEENTCSPNNVREYVANTPGAAKVAQRIIGGIDKLYPGNLESLCAALEYNFDDFHWQKEGDLRYSFVFWVDRPQLMGPLGYGPSYHDPDTGEIIHAMAYVYGAGVDMQAAWGADVVEMINGRQTFDDLVEATQVREAIKRNIELQHMQRQQEVSESFVQEIQRRVGKLETDMAARHKETFTPIPRNHADLRMERMRGTEFEKSFFDNPEWLALTVPGWSPGMNLDEETRQRISPIDTLLSDEHHLSRASVLAESEHCILPTGFTDGSVIGLAMEYDPRSDEDRKEITQYFREQIFFGVMLHEIGHTLGLRHNFAASMDPLNYDDEFWKYLELDEDPAIAALQVNGEVSQRLNRCVEKAEEWGIPVPTTMQCLRTSEMMQSSVMDYGAKFNSRFSGLGKYDHAAIKFGYGQLVEVFDEEIVAGAPRHLPDMVFIDNYRKYPTFFGGSENIGNRKLVPYADYQRRLSRKMVELASNLPRFRVVSQEEGFECIANCNYRVVANEVPYRFCEDYYASSGVPHCRRWDEGPTHEEAIYSMVERSRNYYPFYAFRRGRIGWDPNRYLNWLRANNLAHMVRTFQYFHYYHTRLISPDLDLYQDFLKASVHGLNFLAEVLQTPEPGTYCPDAEGNYRLVEDDGRGLPSFCEHGEALEIPLGVGKPMWMTFNDDFPFYQIDSIGSYWEKASALLTLTDSTAFFVQTSDDSRAFNISYYRLFHDEVLELMGGMITGEGISHTGQVVDWNGKPTYMPRPLITYDTYRLGDRPEAGPSVISRESMDLRDFTLLAGMARLTSTVDDTMEFRDFFQVTVKDSVDDHEYGDIDYDDEDDYVEFRDPNGTRVYRAATNPRNERLSFGYRMVARANELYQEKYLPTKAALEAAQAVVDQADADERADAIAAYQEALLAHQEAEIELQRQIELMDRTRFFHRYFGLGN